MEYSTENSINLTNFNQETFSFKHRLYDYINVFYLKTNKVYNSPTFPLEIKGKIWTKSGNKLNYVILDYLKIFLQQPTSSFGVTYINMYKTGLKLYKKSITEICVFYNRDQFKSRNYSHLSTGGLFGEIHFKMLFN